MACRKIELCTFTIIKHAVPYMVSVLIAISSRIGRDCRATQVENDQTLFQSYISNIFDLNKDHFVIGKCTFYACLLAHIVIIAF